MDGNISPSLELLGEVDALLDPEQSIKWAREQLQGEPKAEGGEAGDDGDAALEAAIQVCARAESQCQQYLAPTIQLLARI